MGIGVETGDACPKMVIPGSFAALSLRVVYSEDLLQDSKTPSLEDSGS
jgi:hypothetical protein